jgi:nucleotide-binding universal stress UspA family protein
MKTLLLHLEAGRANSAQLAIGQNLAQRLQARVIGVAVCRPSPLVMGDGAMDSTWMAQENQALEGELRAAEAEFRGVFGARAGAPDWRAAVHPGPLAEFVAHEARCADLVVTAAAADGVINATRTANTGDLVRLAGRPVLAVPATAAGLTLKRMLVAWNDSREARRAAADAVPMLRLAEQVVVAEVAAGPDLPAARLRLADVVAWLEHQGVAARALAVASTGNDTATLSALAQDEDTDIVVAGAYGHSRWREWALGGVTRDLLLQPGRCALLAH